MHSVLVDNNSSNNLISLLGSFSNDDGDAEDAPCKKRINILPSLAATV